jgi:hypothetical protein
MDLSLVKNLGRPTQQFHRMHSSPLPFLQIHRPIHTCGGLRCSLYLKLCPQGPPLFSATTVNVDLYYVLYIARTCDFSYVIESNVLRLQPIVPPYGTPPPPPYVMYPPGTVYAHPSTPPVCTFYA